VDVASILNKLWLVFQTISVAPVTARCNTLLANLEIPFLLDCLVAKPNFTLAA